MVDKDRIQGSAEQAKGSIKKGVGELTGDETMQAEKAEGKARSAVGGARDAAHDMMDKDCG